MAWDVKLTRLRILDLVVPMLMLMLMLKMTHMFTLGRSVDAMNSFPILVIVTMVLSVWLPEKISLIIYIHDRWKRDFWLFQKNSLISGMSPAPQLSPDPSSFSYKMKTIMLHSKYLFVCGLTVHQTLHCKKSLTTGPMVICGTISRASSQSR